jgi:hypothetical protein
MNPLLVSVDSSAGDKLVDPCSNPQILLGKPRRLPCFLEAAAKDCFGTVSFLGHRSSFLSYEDRSFCLT